MDQRGVRKVGRGPEPTQAATTEETTTATTTFQITEVAANPVANLHMR